MAKEIYIPKLGQTMEQATIARWLVEDGAQVSEGQPILEVETDKANFGIEANASGYLHVGPYKKGDVLPVLTVVAVIGKPEDKFDAKLAKETKAAKEDGETIQAQAIAIASVAADVGRVFASPRARKLAAENGVNLALVTATGGDGQRVVERDVLTYLSALPKVTPVAQRLATVVGLDWRTLTGSGAQGKVTKKDVERQLAAPAPTQLSGVEVVERVPLEGVRGIIAERMAASAHTTARVTLFMEVDTTEFVTMRERLKARVADAWGFAPGYSDLLAKIVATALRQFPYMNARLAPDAIERLAHINVGMAIDTERGLLVPVIRDADKKNLRQLSAEFRELVGRARAGKAMPDDLTGGTFTITNLGMHDVLAFTPIINLPEAAILGVGCITPKPVVREEQVVVRQMLLLSLVFDHRVVDGAPAARFLQHIKALIEEPYLLVAEMGGAP